MEPGLSVCVAVLSAAVGQATEPPPIMKGLVGLEVRERGALLVEDFGAAEINTDRWRIWEMDPEATTFDVAEGRFVITGRGPLGHNGLWSLDAARMKDVTLVGRMDIESSAPECHEMLLHLCGGDQPRSPDHWAEISLRDLRDGQVRVSVLAAVPKDTFDQWGRQLDLPRPEDGLLARVSLDGSSNRVSAEVRDAEGEWISLVDPFPLHLRTTHCEIKMRGRGGVRPEDESTGWFDDVRIYPRAAAHPIMVRLRRAGDAPIFSRGETGHSWPPKIRIEDGTLHDLEELVVELLTADGETVVAAAQSNNLGDYMLPLDAAPWDVYPVAARIRLRLGDRQLGQAEIPLEGLSGLYPDAVYDVVVE